METFYRLEEELLELQKNRRITVNQVGYPAKGTKAAALAGVGGAFQVIDASSGAVVFEGKTSAAIEDKASGVTVCTADFSDVAHPGQYRIEHNGEKSAEFTITEKPYQELHKGLLKAFYFLRCGMELTEEFAGPWTHAACHTSEGIVYGQTERRLDSSGGWHDAGDYGKYAGPGAKAIADLLLSYEFHPKAYAEAVPLPETDGRTPDVLHEARYELEWLFKMQDSETGGVFHKLTTLQFPGYIMPEEDKGDLYFMPISAAATGCVAGVMAMAARTYKPFDAEFAERCLQSALRAWAWLERNPEVPGFKNPPNVGTGEYGDGQDIDERYWAAAELYRTTGDSVYHEAFLKLAQKDFYKFGLGWADMSGYGTLAYLLNGEDKADRTQYTGLQAGLQSRAKQIVEQSSQDGYHISLAPEDYHWGSNMEVMNNAMLLLIAHHLFGAEEFEACTLDHIHYLMGRNVLDVSYVTGYGDRAYRHPHYRPGIADGVDDPVPGMVSGGPNQGLQDDPARKHLQGKAPAQCFIDDEDSYSTNEITIYWNSPAVFVAAHWAK